MLRFSLFRPNRIIQINKMLVKLDLKIIIIIIMQVKI